VYSCLCTPSVCCPPYLQLTSKRSIYRSSDGGKTWSGQMELLHSLASQHPSNAAGPSANPIGINSIVRNSHGTIVLVGDTGTHFFTNDAGRSFHVIWHADKLGASKACICSLLVYCTLTRSRQVCEQGSSSFTPRSRPTSWPRR
jgi:hypothetical protein